MCEYCKLEPGVPGEWTSDIPTIGGFNDGNLLYECLMNRYIDEDSEYRKSELILRESVRLRNDAETIQEHFIPIKYCPFCGEKL